MAVEQLSSSAKTVIISMNPNSGSSDRSALVDQLRDSLRELGLQPVVLTEVSEVKRQVVDLLERHELRTVVAAGGDGTVSLLANELPEATPLVILPLGTENLLAKFLEQTADPFELANVINEGRTVRLDAGRANGKLFLVMAGCGFDAEVVTRLHADRRGHIRHWSYAKPILGAILGFRYPLMRMWVDDDPHPIEGRWAFVFNVPRYAMNLPIASDANSQDGKLDLCTFQQGSFLRGLFYLLTVLVKRHQYLRECRQCQFQRLRIETESKSNSVPYQLDGDPGGELPLEIEVQPKFLRVVVSKAWIDKNGG